MMRVAGSALAALLLAVPAGAQQPADSARAARTDSLRGRVLPELTATTALPAARTRVPPNATDLVVDPALLRRTQATSAWDLLRRVAGVEVREQGQGPGFASNAILRGFTSDHSSDVLLVVDGMPVNLAANGHTEGYADWSLLVPAAVRALTVRHGPTDARFGDFALGGVVEVETAPEVAASTAALGGSAFGDAWGWLQAGARSERGGLALTSMLRRDQGWRENAGARSGSALLRGWRAVGAGRLDGSVGVFLARWDAPGFLDTTRYGTGRFEALRAPFDDTDGGDAWRAYATARWTGPVAPSLVLRAGVWAQALDQQSFLNIPGGPLLRQTEERDQRVLAGGTVELGRPVGPGVLEVAVQGRADDGRFRNTRTDQRTPLLALDDLDFQYLNGAAYARWRGAFLARVRVDAAVRGDLLRYRARDRLTGAPATTGSHAVLSPKLGVDVDLAGPLALHAAVSRGFRGAPGVVFETASRPVTAWATEVGLVVRAPRLELELSAFRYDVRNEKIQDPVTLAVSTAGASTRRGLELRAAATPVAGLALWASGTWNDATITAPATFTGRGGALAARALPADRPTIAFHDDGGLVPGARVPGVATYFGQAGAEVRLTPRLALRGVGRFSGPFVPFREAAVRTDRWLIGDAGLGWQLPRAPLTLDLELQNLANTLYTEVRASGFLNAGAPRTVRASLTARW